MKNSPLTEHMRLNRFISQAGVCARRAADALIQAGYITVNGQRVSTLGYQVTPEDVIKYRDQVLSIKQHSYILLNKPKDYITTTKDPQGRKTVLSLVKNAASVPLNPVGRLDRNTTGLLLLTNDGTLAHQLSHPTSQITKLYDVVLNKPLSAVDFEKIQAGVLLEDRTASVDQLAVVSQDRRNIGLAMHMGRNRVVRRIFEHLNYEVMRLDRVMYACLTKKNLPRGKWRVLTSQEVHQLKKLSALPASYANTLRVQ